MSTPSRQYRKYHIRDLNFRQKRVKAGKKLMVARPRRRKIRRPLPIGGFPRSLKVKLRYVQTFTLNPVAGGIAVQAFRANSLYDPDQTGVGHQPSNYDRLTDIYDRYTVLGSKCTVKPVQASTTGYQPGTLVLHLSENGGDLAIAHGNGVDNVLEQPRLVQNYMEIGNMNNIQYPQNISLKFSAKKFFGIRSVVGKSPYTADTLANPTEGAFYEVAFMSPDDSNDPGAITLRVTIDYIAVMTEPKLADAS